MIESPPDRKAILSSGRRADVLSQEMARKNLNPCEQITSEHITIVPFAREKFLGFLNLLCYFNDPLE